ncbi:alpha/beta hydrolase [Ascidiaceihabitans sp.]|uniref:alpha/beta fold hydrolase n=1 Tax=Ascidiaceihabitans sp. TaxID=1872644 RepID=UPI00329723F5
MTAPWTSAPDARLHIGDADLEYACFGPTPDQTPTLVMLHEGLGSLSLWRDLPERLAAATGWGVVAYSRAGYGQSSTVPLPRPMDYADREAKDVLGTVLNALGVGSCVLMGHSEGASICAIYAGSVSDMRVRGLVLIAPHFFADPRGLAHMSSVRTAYETGGLREKMARHHADPDVAFFGWHDRWTHPDQVRWNIADSIDHWRIPVLAIQGSDDAYGSLDQITEIEDRIYAPLETLLLDGIGHMPQFEAPDVTLSAITEFCTRLQAFEQAPSPIV